jgi:hypothetical protein
MYPRDWQLFLRDGAGKEIAIAQLSAELTRYLGVPSEKVFLHQTYAVKATQKHQLGSEHFPLIFDAIDRGLVVEERPLHLTFFHFDAERQRWFELVIKKAQDTGRVYLCTFHRVSERKVENRKRTKKVIRT